MVADTYSSILGFLDQGTGNNNNTWGDNCDLSIFPVFERAIAGSASRSIAGGTTDLSAGGSNPPNTSHAMMDAIQILTGTLLATHTIIVANITKSWTFINNTTGNFGVLFKTPSGTAVNIPQGKLTTIFCDGSNGMHRDDKEHVGDFIHYGGTAVPGGTFECTGGTKLIADYPDYFAKVGTTWGGNGTTTVGVPDSFTAGKFLRGRSAGQALAVAQTNQNKAHTHTFSATTDAGGDHNHGGATGTNGAHTHTINDPGHTHTLSYDFSATKLGNSGGSPVTSVGSGTQTATTASAVTNISINSNGDHTHTISASGTHTHTLSGTTASDGGTEARPENIAAILCIKY
jgi:microcystin-dependent protein